MEKLVYNLEKKRWQMQRSGEDHFPEIQDFDALLNLFKAADFFYITIGPGKKTCSDGVREVLGFEPDEFTQYGLSELVHPDDLEAVEAFAVEAEEFFESLSPAGKPFGKAQYTFRMRTKSGSYKQVMLQKTLSLKDLLSDGDYMLVITDLSRLKTDGRPSLSLVQIKGGHSRISITKNAKTENLPELSARQWEVLKSVLDTCDLHEAADALGITATTLRNHLMTIRTEVNAKSMVHLLALAEKKKWFTNRNE